MFAGKCIIIWGRERYSVEDRKHIHASLAPSGGRGRYCALDRARSINCVELLGGCGQQHRDIKRTVRPDDSQAAIAIRPRVNLKPWGGMGNADDVTKPRSGCQVWSSTSFWSADTGPNKLEVARLSEGDVSANRTLTVPRLTDPRLH